VSIHRSGQHGEWWHLRDARTSVGNRPLVQNQKALCLSGCDNFGATKKSAREGSHALAACCLPELRGEVEISQCITPFYLARYDEVEVCARAALKSARNTNWLCLPPTGSRRWARSLSGRKRRSPPQEAILQTCSYSCSVFSACYCSCFFCRVAETCASFHSRSTCVLRRSLPTLFACKSS